MTDQKQLTLYTAVIDLETGGLSPYINPVLQIGCIIADESYNTVEEWSTYVKPFQGSQIEQRAIEVNGIQPEQYENAPNELEALNGLNSVLARYNTPIIAGFNVVFDLSFLNSIAFRNKSYLVSDGQFLDFRPLVRFVTGSYKYSLDGMCKEFGIENKKAHDGISDCRATLGLAKAVLIDDIQRKVSV